MPLCHITNGKRESAWLSLETFHHAVSIDKSVLIIIIKTLFIFTSLLTIFKDFRGVYIV